MNEPKERPILFSGPMVRAIIDGRKTQARRVIKHRENRWECGDDGATGKVWPFWPCYVFGEPEPIDMPCPYGNRGDRLWVREKSRVASVTTGHGAWYSLEYAAGGGSGVMLGEMPGRWFPAISHNIDGSMRWQPSNHMPRWASRITLEVTGVRVERLQDISEADAMAEGAERPVLSATELDGMPVHPMTGSYADGFRDLCESINGPESWAANPWVWVIEFQKVEVAK